MVTSEVLEIIKNKLDITWADEQMEKKLSLIVENGIAELDRLNGVKNDYIKAGKAQSLLFSYVVYDLSNCLDDFKKNYKSDIVSFINQSKVKKAQQNVTV